jgi:uncharacterized membrane protein YeaQ/YmgE (transglycosylase-associated protein family)
MHLIWSAIIGLVVGAIAKLFMPGKDGGGIFVTMLLGIGGSLIFTYLGRFLGFYGEGESAGFIASILGAMIILFIYRFIKKKTA